MPAIVKTFFDRRAMPTNLMTVSEWMRFARATKKGSWEAAARYYAGIKGGAVVMRHDDSLVVFTKRGEKISRRTYRPGKWGWAA